MHNGILKKQKNKMFYILKRSNFVSSYFEYALNILHKINNCKNINKYYV